MKFNPGRFTARPLSIGVPGAWYHVVNRGHRLERIFLTDEDRRAFPGRLEELTRRLRVEVHAFVLMDNHDHLLVRPMGDNLSRPGSPSLLIQGRS